MKAAHSYYVKSGVFQDADDDWCVSVASQGKAILLAKRPKKADALREAESILADLQVAVRGDLDNCRNR